VKAVPCSIVVSHTTAFDPPYDGIRLSSATSVGIPFLIAKAIA
jgi:hypothetical protein